MSMPRTLLVTNDFPPTLGGIQSYLRDFVATLPPEEIVVFASTQDTAAAAAFDASVDYRVVRWARSVMLPTKATAQAMAATIEEFGIDTVWFGASTPLGLLAPAARAAGVQHIVASSHGHEVGWAMLPGGRRALRRIGNNVDIVTYISDYTRARITPALGDQPEYVALPSGVDTEYFQPATPSERERTRARFELGDVPVIVCVSRLVRRKGQDQLIRCLPEIRRRHPGSRLVIVGEGPGRSRLEHLAATCGVTDAVLFTGPVTRDDMRDLLAAADVAAIPARTRLGGLDVEGLGIVFLEAQATGVPVIVGDSGGAPETLIDGSTGFVINGRSRKQLVDSVDKLLSNAELRTRMGVAARTYAQENWAWPRLAQRFAEVLAGA